VLLRAFLFPDCLHLLDENLGCKHQPACHFFLLLRDRTGRGVKDCARFEA
jgi:hypothetical protein